MSNVKSTQIGFKAIVISKMEVSVFALLCFEGVCAGWGVGGQQSFEVGGDDFAPHLFFRA